MRSQEVPLCVPSPCVPNPDPNPISANPDLTLTLTHRDGDTEGRGHIWTTPQISGYIRWKGEESLHVSCDCLYFHIIMYTASFKPVPLMHFEHTCIMFQDFSTSRHTSSVKYLYK